MKLSPSPPSLPVPHNTGAAGRQSGQVLVIGIFILIILLFAVLAGVDIYNAIRAKLKVETAQESAAIAGAVWQKHSLNLIGELNMLKACTVLVAEDDKFRHPLPQIPQTSDPATRQEWENRHTAALQSRLDVLTEMQSRVSFMGPLIGFAAANQAAKANGISSKGALNHYLSLLDTSSRYRWEFGSAPRYINNFEWHKPYTEFVRAISDNGIAIFPNARTSYTPTVYPSQLNMEGFYNAILRHAEEIKNANGEPLPFDNRTNWNDSTSAFVYKDLWKSRFESPPWWDINYSLNSFPKESEIFTLGVETSPLSYADHASDHQVITQTMRQTAQKANYDSLLVGNMQSSQPGLELKFFFYDKTWYPEYYRRNHSGYDSNHFDYWFNGQTLRRPVKAQYRYEGPAAYAETYADTGRITSIFRVSGQKIYNTDDHSRIGADRSGGGDSELTEYRPGTIAKVFGELPGSRTPIYVPVVLPVFDKVAITPTYMPIPYGFGVLRNYVSALDRFLNWLSRKRDLQDDDAANPLPQDCQKYLLALQYLVQGPAFRYYGWNPAFDADAFNTKWSDKLKEWHQKRLAEPRKYQYSTKFGSDLPGYLQEPNIFYTEERRSGKIECRDYIHGGTAVRHYLTPTSYMVVGGNGKYVSRNEVDPTIDYSSLNPPPGTGPGFSHYGGQYDSQKGPPRI